MLSYIRRSISKSFNDYGSYKLISMSLAMLLVGLGVGIHGFTIADITLNSNGQSSSIIIFAGKKGTNKINQQNSKIGVGFGKSFASDSSATLDDDYAIFPALDARILDTLVAGTFDNDTESYGNVQRPISEEIYQRLDQIYGFPLFNFNKTTGTTTTTSVPDKSRTKTISPADYLLNNDHSDNILYDESELKTTSTTPSTNDLNGFIVDLQRMPPFKNVNVLHVDPMVLSIDDFFTSDDCDRYIEKSETDSVVKSRSPTVGKDATAKAQRTSTTFYHNYENVPELISKASRLLGLSSIDQWEEPQTVRYRRSEKFTWHLDALGPMELQSSSSGQRTATLLVYLTDLTKEDGGATLFRDLGSGIPEKYLRVQPKKGMALLFFPSAGGIINCPFDIRTLHCGEVVSKGAACDKWIAQLWLRQHNYSPTVPPGSRHSRAYAAISQYCS
jgi:hypothetical protein